MPRIIFNVFSLYRWMIPFRARFSVLFHNTADSQRLHFNVITDYRFLAHSQFTGFLISQNTDSHFVSFVSFRKLHEAFYTKQGNKICTFVPVHSSKEKFRSFVCDRQKKYIYIYFFFFIFLFFWRPSFWASEKVDVQVIAWVKDKCRITVLENSDHQNHLQKQYFLGVPLSQNIERRSVKNHN